MATAELLIPEAAKAYIYDQHHILGQLSSPDFTPIRWCGHVIYCDERTPTWLLVLVTADSIAEANHLARYQADRVMSGMYPCYVSEAS